jgi:hypothetical protein
MKRIFLQFYYQNNIYRMEDFLLALYEVPEYSHIELNNNNFINQDSILLKNYNNELSNQLLSRMPERQDISVIFVINYICDNLHYFIYKYIFNEKSKTN